MSLDLEEIKKAVAEITAKIPGYEPGTGTAFYIGGGYVLTALHVVADIDQIPPLLATAIELDFKFAGHHVTQASFVEGMWDRTGDWAVLRCTDPPAVTPLVRGDTPAKKEWDSFGYPTIQRDGKTLNGDVRDPSARYRGADVIELFSEDAAAGRGTPLHGFSGAPCIVNGRVSGLLRSTLITETLDGRLQPVLLTEAGTVYACPSRTIVDWQAAKGVKVLPDTWAPAGIVTRDFIVFRSTFDQHKLDAVVKRAYEHLTDLGLGEPFFESAAAVVSSEKSLMDVIPALCKAKVVIFDATGFEPSVMLLTGLRAVVRRGVTILSVGGNHSLGDSLDIPFNITDANIVAHSKEQDARKPTSVALLSDRIRRGLNESGSPYYLDMPVYDALRRLPAERRGIIANEEGVLVLCPLHSKYTEEYWGNIKLAFDNELSLWRKKLDKQGAPALGVARSFELNSPRLVTQAIYEAIRRAQACVIDLSFWSPNVLFELGVRLAATPRGTACMIEKEWAGKLKNENWRSQCSSIVSMFVDDKRKYDPAAEWDVESAYAESYGPRAQLPTSGPSGGALHALIEKSLDIDSEPASRTVYRELMDSAELFAKPPGGGRSKPVGLYPGNVRLPQREEEAEFERLLAAWFYLSNRYTTKQLLANDYEQPRAALREIIRSLLARHFSKLTRGVQTRLRRMRDVLENREDSDAGERT